MYVFTYGYDGWLIEQFKFIPRRLFLRKVLCNPVWRPSDEKIAFPSVFGTMKNWYHAMPSIQAFEDPTTTLALKSLSWMFRFCIISWSWKASTCLQCSREQNVHHFGLSAWASSEKCSFPCSCFFECIGEVRAALYRTPGTRWNLAKLKPNLLEPGCLTPPPKKATI